MSASDATTFDFESTSGSDVGRVRKVNEDSILEATQNGLWVVADGMGGHAAGDFASQTVVAAMGGLGISASCQELRHRVIDRLSLANQQIHSHGEVLGRGSIGSTVVALLAFEDRFLCYWSGDSRIYLQRDEGLRQVTRDHTEVQALLDTGTITPAQAATWPRRNVITRAIGVTLDPEVEMTEGQLQDRDLFLLCSDGLTEYFDIEELSQVLTMREWDLTAKCRFLISQAVARGGKDNVSVILVYVRENGRSEIEFDRHISEFES